MPPRARLALTGLTTLLSLFVAAVASQALVGQVARNVDVVSIFASGFGAGAGVVLFVATLRGRLAPR